MRKLSVISLIRRTKFAYLTGLFLICGTLSPLSVDASEGASTLEELKDHLTVRAEPRQMRVLPDLGRLEHPFGERPYAVLEGARGVSWKWPRESFLPGLEYELSVEFGDVESLVDTTGWGLRFFVWNASADPAGPVDEEGESVSRVLSRGELRALGRGVSETVVGVFRPAEFEGRVNVDIQSFVPEQILKAGGSFPRIYEFRLSPVLEGKTESELKEIEQRWRAKVLDTSELVTYGAVELSEEWTVFGPFLDHAEAIDWSTLTGYEEIPARLSVNDLTYEARSFRSERNQIDFRKALGEFPSRTEALIFIPVTVKEAGPVDFGFGADWWFAAYLGGDLLMETFSQSGGNVASPPNPSNHQVTRWLPAGEHLLAIRLMAGRGSATLAVAGPGELAGLGPNEWAPVKPKTGARLGPEVVPGGDFEFPADDYPETWQFGINNSEFNETELQLVSDLAFEGEQSLLIDTTSSEDGLRKLIIPLRIDPKRLYRFHAAVQYLGGEGYLSMTVQDDTKTGTSEYMLGVGKDLRLYQPTKEVRDFEVKESYTYFNIPEVYLVIRAHGPVKVRLDQISIRAASDSLQFTGHGVQKHPWSEEWFDLELSSEVTTPHTAWAKPLHGGELRVAGLMPYWDGRHLVEMAQRMPLDYKFLPFEEPTEWINNWWTRDESGEPALFRAREWIEASIAEDPVDAFILWEMSASTLGDAVVEKLLKRVEEGAGLVITGFDQPYWPKPDGERPEALAAFEKGAWGEALNDATARAGTAAASGIRIDPRADIRFYSHGAGRVAFFKSYDAQGKNPESMDVYEGRMAAFLKALHWSAARVPQVRLAGLEVDGIKTSADVVSITPDSNLDWILEGSAEEGTELRWWVERERNGLRWIEKSQKVPSGATRLDWPEGAKTLPGGDFYLGAQIVKDGKILDWAQFKVAKEAGARIKAIRVDSLNPFLTEDESVRGEVALMGATRPAMRVELRLEDSAGNLWSATSAAPEQGKVSFDFGPVPARHLVHRVSATLLDEEGLELDSRIEEFSVVRNASFYATFFDHQIWQLPGTYLGSLAARQFRKQGVSSAYWAKPSTEGVAKANIRGIPSLAQNYPPKMRVRGDLAKAPEMAIPLASPGRIRQMQNRVDLEMTEMDGGKWAPLAYGQGHESNMRGFGVRTKQDVCFAPASLASFQRFAEEEYESLSDLNEAWGTTFSNWEQVRPVVLDEALKAEDLSGGLARWINHRRHMDRVYLNYMEAKRSAARDFIPGFEATHDNFYGMDSFSGVDLWLQLSELVAGAGIGGGLLQAFTPPERKHLMLKRNAIWHPIMITEDDELMEVRFGLSPWHHLLEGYHGSTYWTGHFTGTRFPNSNFGMPLLADHRMSPLGSWLGHEIERIREGVDKIVFASETDDGGIAILYSRESEHAATAWQGINFRDETSQTIWPENEAAAVGALLQNSGYQYRRISNTQITEGALSGGDIRLLILPFSQAISPEVAGQIEDFVENGGKVLADIRPAVVNLRGEQQRAGLLDQVFGIRQNTDWSAFRLSEMALDLDYVSGSGRSGQSGDHTVLVGSASEASALSVHAREHPPVFHRTSFGAGQSLFLNIPFSRLTSQGEASLLDWLVTNEIKPPFELWALDASVNRTTTEALAQDEDLVANPEGFMGDSNAIVNPLRFRHVFDSIDIVGVSSHRQRKGSGLIQYGIEWPTAGYVYELMSGRLIGRESESVIEVAREGVAVFAVVPYEIEAPELEVTSNTLEDRRNSIKVKAKLQDEAANQRHVVQFIVLKPDGSLWFELPESRYSNAGVALFEVTLPINAPAGAWTIVAREAISREETSVMINPSIPN